LAGKPGPIGHNVVEKKILMAGAEGVADDLGRFVVAGVHDDDDGVSAIRNDGIHSQGDLVGTVPRADHHDTPLAEPVRSCVRGSSLRSGRHRLHLRGH
jgi:hypothetical protein